MNVTVAERVSDPLVPVTVTWTSWAVLKVHDSPAVPLAETLFGVRVQDVLLLARFTVKDPWNSFTVMVEAPALPALTVTLVGLAVTEKS